MARTGPDHRGHGVLVLPEPDDSDGLELSAWIEQVRRPVPRAAEPTGRRPPGRRAPRRQGLRLSVVVLDDVFGEDTPPQSGKTRYIVCVRVGAPARKHGVPEEDMQHAVRNAMRLIKVDEDLTMFIGPARDASPLEIGVLDLDGDDPVIIHAMPLRPKFRRYLG